jgi:hypothetical protein
LFTIPLNSKAQIKKSLYYYQTDDDNDDNNVKETGIKLDKKHWYKHVPKSVETSQEGKVTILWNQQVQTDTTIPNKRPDISRDNKRGTCMLIDDATSEDKNVIKCPKHFWN